MNIIFLLTHVITLRAFHRQREQRMINWTYASAIGGSEGVRLTSSCKSTQEKVAL